MRKIVGITFTAFTVMFGAVVVANASALSGPARSSTTTTLADDADKTGNNQQHDDHTGLWGLAGILGLVGLAGLKPRKNNEIASLTDRSTQSPRA